VLVYALTRRAIEGIVAADRLAAVRGLHVALRGHLSGCCKGLGRSQAATPRCYDG